MCEQHGNIARSLVVEYTSRYFLFGQGYRVYVLCGAQSLSSQHGVNVVVDDAVHHAMVIFHKQTLLCLIQICYLTDVLSTGPM